MIVKSLKSLLKLFSWNCIIFWYSYWSFICILLSHIVLIDSIIYIVLTLVLLIAWHVNT